MTEKRLEELQTEIAKLREIDRKISDRVSAELDADILARHSYIHDLDEIPCSLKQDMEWANESENIQ